MSGSLGISGSLGSLGTVTFETMGSNDLGSLGKIEICNFTYETLIKVGINNGFELINYKDAEPTKTSKKYDTDKYKLTITLPTFILFKFKKK